MKEVSSLKDEYRELTEEFTKEQNRVKVLKEKVEGEAEPEKLLEGGRQEDPENTAAVALVSVPVVQKDQEVQEVQEDPKNTEAVPVVQEEDVEQLQIELDETKIKLNNIGLSLEELDEELKEDGPPPSDEEQQIVETTAPGDPEAGLGEQQDNENTDTQVDEEALDDIITNLKKKEKEIIVQDGDNSEKTLKPNSMENIQEYFRLIYQGLNKLFNIEGQENYSILNSIYRYRVDNGYLINVDIEDFMKYVINMDENKNKIVEEAEFVKFLPENMNINAHDKMFSTFFEAIKKDPTIVEKIKNSVPETPNDEDVESVEEVKKANPAAAAVVAEGEEQDGDPKDNDKSSSSEEDQVVAQVEKNPPGKEDAPEISNVGDVGSVEEVVENPAAAAAAVVTEGEEQDGDPKDNDKSSSSEEDQVVAQVEKNPPGKEDAPEISNVGDVGSVEEVVENPAAAAAAVVTEGSSPTEPNQDGDQQTVAASEGSSATEPKKEPAASDNLTTGGSLSINEQIHLAMLADGLL